MKKLINVLSLIVLIGFVTMGMAQEGEEASAAVRSIGDGLIALGAGLAIGVGAIGVGLAQASIGSAGAGFSFC